MSNFSTASIDYLQRSGESLATSTGETTSAALRSRALVHIRGIGRPEKILDTFPPEKWLPATAGLIAGIYGYRIPLAFTVESGGDGMRVRIGTWSGQAKTAPSTIRRRLDVVSTVLRGLYPLVHVSESDATTAAWPLSGLSLGIPSTTPPTKHDPTNPWDRISRAMGSTEWAVLVLAQPLSDAAVTGIRHGVINEMRIVQESAKAESAPSPLAEFYVEMLKRSLKELTAAAATGAWRTACYLLGDGESYPRLASTWRSVFSGPESLPEPVRVFDAQDVSGWAGAWAMPDDRGRPGPGVLHRLYEFQTVLTSNQLSTYVHLPQVELPGFAVDIVPYFDAVKPPIKGSARVDIGKVVYAGQPSPLMYSVAKRALTKHALVAGITGGGKSTTIFQILEQLDCQNVPFLVVEPAKAEYRTLLEHPRIGPKLQVFTLGDERTSPFRINPLEVPPGVTVSQHIDVVRALMAGSFGMWTPLPQILERCLYEVYADRGWDLVTSTNLRADGGTGHPRASPTLSHLTAKIPSVIAALGYEERISRDMQASLLTRLDSLRSGGKGRMLDVTSSVPMEVLLSRPTVIELDPMGDDDDKAFLMGLLLVRLVQHRRGEGPVSDLVHMLVIEEAHRLLSASARKAAQEEADPKGKVVEMFSNLLSEIRAYGQGVLIADQVPVRLAPDVLKNTGLKIAHRTVAGEDREALAGAMSMTPLQSQALTTFGPGRAAVFGDGDDTPVIVQVPDLKASLDARLPTADRVAAHMSSWRSDRGLQSIFRVSEVCVESCVDADQECRHARRMLDERAVQSNVSRLLLATLTEVGALHRLHEDLLQLVRARSYARLDEAKLLRSLSGHGAEWFAERRGAQGRWGYEMTDAVALAARRMLLAVQRKGAKRSQSELNSFKSVLDAAFTRVYDPYPMCAAACGPTSCRYRFVVADAVEQGAFDAAWKAADTRDATEGNRAATWELAQDAAFDIVEWPTGLGATEDVLLAAAARSAGLCFAQQMVERDSRKIPRLKRWALGQVLEHVDGPQA